MLILRTILAILFLAGVAASPALAAGLTFAASDVQHCEIASASGYASTTKDCGDCDKDAPCPALACAAIGSQVVSGLLVASGPSVFPAPAPAFFPLSADGPASWLDSIQPPPPRA